jgi:hypothetical protein
VTVRLETGSRPSDCGIISAPAGHDDRSEFAAKRSQRCTASIVLKGAEHVAACLAALKRM